MKKIYMVNNFSGVDVGGLKNSVYDLKKIFDGDLLEENTFEEDRDLENTNLKNLREVLDINKRVYEYADKLFKNSYTPIMLGGDHSIAMATVAASASNFDEIALIWIDAHTDINTESTSPSGNIHGMPVAASLGLCESEISLIGGDKPKIKAENIVYLGLRSVDSGEVNFIEKFNIKAYYYDEIKERGLGKVLNETKEYLKDKKIHLSFDLDSMDPSFIKGVSTPVEGGFSLIEVEEIFDFLMKNFDIISYDFVEYNKGRDLDGQSLKTLIKLINKVIK